MDEDCLVERLDECPLEQYQAEESDAACMRGRAMQADPSLAETLPMVWEEQLPPSDTPPRNGGLTELEAMDARIAFLQTLCLEHFFVGEGGFRFCAGSHVLACAG